MDYILPILLVIALAFAWRKWRPSEETIMIGEYEWPRF